MSPDMATEAGLRDTLAQLEKCRATGPNAQHRCNYCRAFRASGALCLDCNDRRLELKERLTPKPGGVHTWMKAVQPSIQCSPVTCKRCAQMFDINRQSQACPHPKQF